MIFKVAREPAYLQAVLCWELEIINRFRLFRRSRQLQNEKYDTVALRFWHSHHYAKPGV
jgi:hypothetical protein